MRVVVLAALLLTACTVEQHVLYNDAGVIVACDQLRLPFKGDEACAFAGTCELTSPDDPICCTEQLTCADGLLQDSRNCRSDCMCGDDSNCERGVSFCGLTGYCERCPTTGGCPSCPGDWVPLERNGCPTCLCGPPPQCDMPGTDCVTPNGVDLGTCYSGQTCAPACDATQPGCCSNVCAPLGCPEPAPVGCSMICPPEAGCSSQCAASECSCAGGMWQCTAVCVGDTPLTCRIE